MDAIKAARELGKAIQLDERYIAMELATQRSEEDTELQAMIAEFNNSRTNLNAELSKEDKDGEQIQAMDAALKKMYQAIFARESMMAFNSARDGMQEMMDFVNQIITGSAEGQNPDTIEYQANCGGDCSGCSGCH